ncbi:efflux RND transporter periplasmic adaptor subunit [Pararhizobium sp. IMCC21322]|uniref:efflux RND transporter periplasmic adaptor subunit n=1 Tax=Pararhizobium sp. IMCC21322 TaxID=3067903 RepID=UPI002740602C|nr:efflux RND transporter periplasmic adaptor subunit [Pararhizobium sp. IMCC21322]
MIAKRAVAAEPPAETLPIMISTSTIQMLDSYSVTRNFVGQIEAPQTVQLAFEQGGTLEEAFVDDGDEIAAGQILARLDARLLQADVDRLRASKRIVEAQKELAVLTAQRQAELNRKGFASSQTTDETRLSVIGLEARIAEADAEILAALIRLEKTVIRAPFDGRVNLRLIDQGSTVAGGQAIFSLVEKSTPVFRVGIAPQLADQLSVGQTIEVMVAGNFHAAEIIAILPQIDPTTRTRILRAALLSTTDIALGLTGKLSLLEDVQARGAWLPLSAIEDGVRGLWIIKTLNEVEERGGRAEIAIEAVEIIHADSNRAYVRGTFENGTQFVENGVHRIVGGQTVRLK